ncbi:hypothetical protein ACET3Z_020052 [Daucus carota]
MLSSQVKLNHICWLIQLNSAEPDTSRWLSIDCGADGLPFDDDLIIWDTDDGYIQSGLNELVRTKTSRNELNTLRAFPDKAVEHCYNVSAVTQTIRYIIRLGFYYGNYDGLSKPPRFDLFINHVKWTTVDTSINNGLPFYEEIIYQNEKSGSFKICLVQIKDGGVPLINSIETMVVFDELYPEMDTSATYSLVTRTNLGGPEVRYHIDTDEMYNRIWSKDATPYTRVTGFPDFNTYENNPPITILEDAIVANGSDPITLIVNLPQSTQQSAYIVLYLTNLGNPFDSNQTTTLKFEINSQDQGTVNSTGNGKTTVVAKYPVTVSGPTINITLSLADEFSLPPMISAMEVFTKWDTGPSKSTAAAEFFSFAYSLILLCMLVLVSAGPDTSRWQSIDCGSERSWEDRLLTWRSDYDYSQTGWNKLVGTNTTRDEFNTLRAFPNGSKDDCYNVPIDADMVRYIIRVGFYYGNYDGLSKPPTFDLFINNKKWTTINTSLNEGEPFYEEIIYPNKGSEFFKICLVQIQDGGIPFINSIETVGIFHTLYYEMDTNATYNLVTRINFGGPEVRYGIGSGEIYNRIWSKKAMPYASVSGFTGSFPSPDNYPPVSVLTDAIMFNASDPMTLTIDLPQSTPQSAYIVLYITNLGDLFNPNTSATVKIKIDNQDQGTVEALHFGETTVITKYPVMVSGPSVNITLSPADKASLPPMISAMEVFTKWPTHKSAAAPKHFSSAHSLIILFMLLLVA